MVKSTSIFSQILGLIPDQLFFSALKQSKVEKASKGFSSRQQLVAMMFCQFAQAKSLREISDGLASCEGKLNHLGVKAPGRSTLAYANSKRNPIFFETLFYSLLNHCRLYADKLSQTFKLPYKLYSIDSTVIDLCLSAFNWAKFRTTKGAIKLHMRLDHEGYLPDFCIVTDGKVHDSKTAKALTYDKNAVYVFDRGYNDFKLFNQIIKPGAFFVTRIKDNTRYDVFHKREPTDKSIMLDSTIGWQHEKAREDCPHCLRLIRYYDADKDREFEFLTNNFELAATTIAGIYRERWQIEAFFKLLKQNLKIKTFVGTSRYAVLTQIWTALISILLVKFLKMKSKWSWSMSNFMALLRINLFSYKDLEYWLDNPFNQDGKTT